METPLSGGISGVAEIAARKWFAAMGLVGLLLFATTFIIQIPADIVVTRCVALIMLGWGFGQAECRTFRKDLSTLKPYIVTNPHWRLTVSGALLFATACGAAIKLAHYVLG